MNRNNRLQESVNKLNKSLEALFMAIGRQHLATNKMEQSVKEYFEVKEFLKKRSEESSNSK